MSVFTPRDFITDERLKFNLADVTVLRGDLFRRITGWKATVKIKDKTYDVIGVNCGLSTC